MNKKIGMVTLLFILMCYSSQLFALNLEDAWQKIDRLIQGQSFKEAEQLTRDCLKQAPRDLYFLSKLDIVLNAQEKIQEAEDVRNKILKVWNEDQKQKWLDKGSPKSESSWARIITYPPDFQVVGCEYTCRK